MVVEVLRRFGVLYPIMRMGLWIRIPDWAELAQVVGFRQAFADAAIDLPDRAFIEGDYECRGGEMGIQFRIRPPSRYNGGVCRE
jgi:hypothetical protein